MLRHSRKVFKHDSAQLTGLHLTRSFAHHNHLPYVVRGKESVNEIEGSQAQARAKARLGVAGPRGEVQLGKQRQRRTRRDSCPKASLCQCRLAQHLQHTTPPHRSTAFGSLDSLSLHPFLQSSSLRTTSRSISAVFLIEVAALEYSHWKL